MKTNTDDDIKPQYLGSIAILFWGYQCDLLWFALPMAIIFEARFYFNRRWALTQKDFYQIADLTSVGLLLLVVFLFINRREYHFITTLISWIPILFYPLTIVISYSTTRRMPLDVLFYSLRRQKEPVQQSWDMDYVLIGMCLLAAGLEPEGNYYFPVVALLILLLLLRLRSTRFNLQVFILTFALVVLGASFVHTGMRGAHLALKEKTEEWIAAWIARRTNHLKTHTALGQVGTLKLSDAIAFRIEPLSGRPDFPPLLREAAYNSPGVTDWEVFSPNADAVEPADDFLWEFAPRPMQQYPQAKIYIEFDRKAAIIPVPDQLTEIYELPAKHLKKSAYGTIQGLGLIPSPHYRVRYDTTGRLGAEPSSEDLIIPSAYRDYLASIAPADLSAPEAVMFVQSFFSEFRYTLYQSGHAVSENPLIYFMDKRRAGHCEYFASATALLLRSLGVPSRYVVGYAVVEWNANLAMYTVRERHAHAWAEAWVNGRWITVDTTPARWLGMEENAASFLQPLWDAIDNNQFLFLRWWNNQELEDYERELFMFGLILVGILLWRVYRSEQVVIETAEEESVESWLVPGRESPFFRVEDHLAELGYKRGRGELMANWLLRIDRAELLPLLSSHNRWRFDPRGISIEERRQLAEQVQDWLRANAPAAET